MKVNHERLHPHGGVIMRALRLERDDSKRRGRGLVHPASSVFGRAVARLLLLLATGVAPQPHAQAAPPESTSAGWRAHAPAGATATRAVVAARPDARPGAAPVARHLPWLAAALVPPPPPPLPSAAPATPAAQAAAASAASLAASVAAQANARGIAGEPLLRHLPSPRLPWLAQSGEALVAALGAAGASAPTPDLARDVNLPAGWSLVSVPLVAVNTQAAAVFADLPAPLNLYDFAAGQTLGSDQPGFRNALPGRAFWLLLEHPEALSVVGAPLAENAPQRIALEPGWNAVATPWLTPVAWSDARVSVRHGAETVALGEAVTRGWVQGSLFQYDPAANSYQSFAPNASPAGELRPWQGALLHASSHAELVFSPPPTDDQPPVVSIDAPADAAGVSAPTAVVGSVDDPHLAEWRLELGLAGSNTFATIARGTQPVQAAALGTLDPTLLLNGQYDLRLVARDTGGRTADAAVTVTVKGEMKVGHFRLSFVDLEVPLGGLPIQVIRTYDSRDKGRGDFGIGWRLEFSAFRVHENGLLGQRWLGSRSLGPFPEYCLTAQRPHRVTVTLPDGELLEFEAETQPRCQQILPPAEVSIGFRQIRGTKAQLDALDVGSSLVIGAWPGAGQTAPMLLSAEGTGEPTDADKYLLTLPDGREYAIDQRGGVESLRDASGNSVTIGPAGILHSTGVSVTFQRDALGRVTRIDDPGGGSLIYTYDAAGDLTVFRDRATNGTTFGYGPEHHLLRITDPLGRQPLRNEYDAAGRLVRVTDASGHATEYTHDIPGRQQVIRDRVGGTRLLVYDMSGNVVQETDALGHTTTRTFDDRDNQLSETDAEGNTRRWAYDADDNVIREIDALGQVTTHTYDSGRRRLTTTDPLGRTSSQTYDPQGRRLTQTDAAGHLTTWSYDLFGHVLTVSDALGQTWSHSYGPTGLRTSTTDPVGHEVQYTYDASNRLSSERETRVVGGATELLETRYEYDGLNREVRRVAPDGASQRRVFDAGGQVVAEIDALGRTTSHQYDSLGRRTLTLHPDGSSEARGYDAEGRLVSETDRQGRVTQHEYDALGRRVKTITPDGGERRGEYDSLGRLVAVVGPRGERTRYEYDAAGRRTAQIDPTGARSVLTYDAVGRLLSSTDPAGGVTLYAYDAADRLASVTLPGGSQRTHTYDALGRHTGTTDETGLSTQLAYDALGRLTSTTVDGAVTSYAYDERGALRQRTDAAGRVTRYAYDRAGRRAQRTLPDGTSESWSYDAYGRPATHTDLGGGTTTYAYDAADRVLQRAHSSGLTASFTYTSSGQRASLTDATGTTLYSYDSVDRLTAVQRPDGSQMAFTYNASGQRTALTVSVGNVTLTQSYRYDLEGRLVGLTDPLGHEYTMDYDERGALANLAHPNGVATTFARNERDELTRVTSSGPAGVVQDYVYTLAANGQRTRVDELGGAWHAFGYDTRGRLVHEQRQGGTTLVQDLTYDAVGNRLMAGRSDASGSTTIGATYDVRDRMLTRGNDVLAYDPKGNLLAVAGTNLVWDGWNRLVRVERADGARLDNAYDGDGLLVRSEVSIPGQSVRARQLVVDTADDLSQIVAERDDTGALTAFYVRGRELMAVIDFSVTPPVTRYVHADAQGSVRRLSDDVGALTDSYDYEAFGALLAHAGTSTQPFGYAGEPLDPLTGLAYHRARWMDPSSGRFLGQDLLEGALDVPVSQHPYLYAHDDPANLADPSGLAASLAEVGAVARIQAALASVSVPTWVTVLLRAAAMTCAISAAASVADVIGSESGVDIVPSIPGAGEPGPLICLRNARVGEVHRGLKATNPGAFSNVKGGGLSTFEVLYRQPRDEYYLRFLIRFIGRKFYGILAPIVHPVYPGVTGRLGRYDGQGDWGNPDEGRLGKNHWNFFFFETDKDALSAVAKVWAVKWGARSVVGEVIPYQ